VGSLLGVVSIPVMFIAGGVAWNAFRSGDGKMGLQASAVFIIGVIVFLAAPKATGSFEPECNRYSSFAESC